VRHADEKATILAAVRSGNAGASDAGAGRPVACARVFTGLGRFDDLHQYPADILLAAPGGFVYKSNACLIFLRVSLVCCGRQKFSAAVTAT